MQTFRSRETGYHQNTGWKGSRVRSKDTWRLVKILFWLLVATFVALVVFDIRMEAAPPVSPVPEPTPTLVPPARSPDPIPVWPMLPPTIGDQPAPWVWGGEAPPAENEALDDTIRYVIPICEDNPFGLRHQDLGFD